MTKYLQVWEKIDHNSARGLMTNETFSSSLAQDKGRDWGAQSQDMRTLIDLKLEKTKENADYKTTIFFPDLYVLGFACGLFVCVT